MKHRAGLGLEPVEGAACFFTAESSSPLTHRPAVIRGLRKGKPMEQCTLSETSFNSEARHCALGDSRARKQLTKNHGQSELEE